MQDAGDAGAEQRRTCATQALEAASASLAIAVELHDMRGGEARVKELALATLASVDVFDRGAPRVGRTSVLLSETQQAARACLTQKTSTTLPAPRSEAAHTASVDRRWRCLAAQLRQRRR